MSDYSLTNSQQNLLKKGLKFVPTPKSISLPPLLRAATEFNRKIKLTKFFKTKRHTKKTPFTSKSEWSPPDGSIPTEIHTSLNEIESEISQINIQKPKPNLDKQEQIALSNLKNNQNIVIKKADKGSATVIMNKTDYIFEANRQLSNPTFYEKIDELKQSKTAEKILTILENMKNDDVITEKQFDYLKPPEQPRPRRFYMLPKIHKTQDKWTIPHKIPPGRPIVSNCNSESDKIAEYIENFLKLQSTQHPSYIKNTDQFVSKIKELEIPKNTLLVTLDVDSMYTNINHADAIKAFEETFSDRQNHLAYEPVKQLLSLTLQNNDFEFNGSNFIQTSGVSMGIKYAPSIADIFMAKWEKEALDKYPHKPLFFGRFLDDIFLLWTHGEDKFWEFFNVLNNHHPSIKLKATVSQTEVDFLDTTVFKYQFEGETILCTKVFFKPTDTHALLHKNSFHPRSTFKSIIKSQILRFDTISSLKVDFHEACRILFNSLKHRGYSKRWLRKTIQEIKFDIERKNREEREDPIAGSSKWGYSSGCELSTINRNPCWTCKSTESFSNIQSGSTGGTYPVQGNLHCGTMNVIYVITCILCGMQYVGETGNSVRLRFDQHRKNTYRGQSNLSAVAKHFVTHHKDTSLNETYVPICISPIEQLKNRGSKDENRLARLDREYFWIDTLGTATPYGMNEDRVICKRQEPAQSIIPFIVPYSHAGLESARIAKKHFNTIKLNFDNDFDDHSIITAFQKHKSLQDILVSSKL